MYCGTDIVEVARIKKAIEGNNKFKEKVYSSKEIESIEKILNKEYKYERYAGRFAAKEAVYKAISKVLSENNINMSFLDIEVLNDKSGRPYVSFLGKDTTKILKEYAIDISISHVKDTAIAMCTVSKIM